MNEATLSQLQENIESQESAPQDKQRSFNQLNTTHAEAQAALHVKQEALSRAKRRVQERKKHKPSQ